MRIVICSRTFLPLIGGLENVADLAAHALGELGHKVCVITAQRGVDVPQRSYMVLRQPPCSVARHMYKKADFVLMMNVTLRMLGPMLGTGCRLFLWHHGLWTGPDWRDRFRPIALAKLLVARHFASGHLACSRYVAAALPRGLSAIAIANPYDDTIFPPPSVHHPVRAGILFVGRLVTDKGADLAIRSYAKCIDQLSTPKLRVVGSGPEEQSLRLLVAELGIAETVEFLGPLRSAELADVMRSSVVLVVPSVWQEPFGIVALEGLASGCQVVVSDSGGLPEAVGELGVIVPSRDVAAVSNSMVRLLESQALDPVDRPEALKAHLAYHRPQTVALRILEYCRAQPRGF